MRTLAALAALYAIVIGVLTIVGRPIPDVLSYSLSTVVGAVAGIYMHKPNNPNNKENN